MNVEEGDDYMTTKIQNWGNSLGVRIPKKYVNEFGFENGTEVTIIKEKDGVKIKPVEKKETLEELLSKITDENRHEYIDWGEPQGKEVW